MVDKYLDGQKRHTQKDTQVTLQDVTRGEELIYDTTTLLISIFGIGKEYEGQPDLIAQALKPVYCAVTGMAGLHKDHKSG